MMKEMQSVKSVDKQCKTCCGPHSFTECPAIGGYIQEAAYAATGSLPSNTIANPIGDLKAITTHSGVSYDGPTIPPTPPLSKEVERETKATKDKVFTGALLHMPKFASTFKSLLSNKEKLFELASTLLNENSSAVLLKKLPEKLGDPSKFLIPCNFSELDEFLALADLGTSINLMPLFVWQKLLLPELTSTRMTLELANRSTVIPTDVAKDVFVKVEKFYFLAEFVVVDYDVDPRVPLILERPFLRMARALIDVHGEEMTLRVNDEAITFKVKHTSRYSHNSYDETVHQVNVIEVACEEYAQEVLRFSDSSTSGNPTPWILSLLLFSPRSLLSKEGDIALIEKFLNEYPSPNLPSLRKDDLKQVDVTMTKPSIEEPPELEVKDLPSHLEYAFLEGTDKLPVIISKELKYEEKAALLKVLKLHKPAIAWKISDIKGIDPRFCTHKILMEDDFKPVVQHQRRVNPKIHKVIKKEVIKLLDVGLIYPISNSPKLNDAIRKDHFPLPFMDKIHERLAGNEYHCFLARFSGYFQIPIDSQDQEKTTFTCPYGTFAYRRMPFGLCNAPGTFQRCMIVIFHDMIEETIEVFMDDFSVFKDSFSSCLSHLDKILKRIKVDRAKVDVIAKLPRLTSVKGKLTEASILVSLDWDLPFEIMCDASEYAVGAVFGQHHLTLKYLLPKQDTKPRLLSWFLLLQEFDVIIRDKKGAENLTADHLSRLENPHQGDLAKKEINETFPLETLGMVASRSDSSTSWIAQDFEESRAHGFVHHFLELQSLACLYGNIIPNSRETPSWREIVSLTVLVKLASFT
nr:reverse transcriptase domain-containing protein [Tanacetum cinerariifolium]